MADHQDRPTQEADGAPAAPAAEGAIIRLLDRPLNESDLHEHTLQVGQPPQQEHRRGSSVLIFSIGDELLALPAVEIARVTRAVRAHRVPHRNNEVFLGLGNVEGELMLCASLARLLDIERSAGGKAHEGKTAAGAEGWTIVLGTAQTRWAIVVDAVEGMEPVDPGATGPPPMTVERALVRFTDSLIRVDGKHAALLNAQRVFSGFEAALK